MNFATPRISKIPVFTEKNNPFTAIELQFVELSYITVILNKNNV
jgi:hypothetical protein